jgi:YHS domain-containing protein
MKTVLAAPFLLLGAATPVLGYAPQGGLLVECPVMHKEMSITKMEDGLFRDVLGIRYYLCCGPCQEDFDKTPSRWTKPSPEQKTIRGIALFDPVLGARLDLPRATARATREGILYPFLTRESRASFDKDPKRYASRPEKEQLTCPVTGHLLRSSAEAAGYSDFEGQRIYFDTWISKSKFDANPSAYKERLAEKKQPSDQQERKTP